MDILAKIKNVILDILFPPICISCKSNLEENEKQNKVCNKCMESIIPNSSFFCPICENRLPEDKNMCHRNSKFILTAATSYQTSAAKNLIWFLKYRKWRGLVKTMEPIIHKYLDNLKYDFNEFAVMPIPLHKDRLQQRGFNQSELIAEIFCRKTNCQLITNNLLRIKPTKTQAELKNTKERSENVKGCFTVLNPEEIKNKNIVLVDDVFTTGSTISEAAETLKRAGAKKIIAFVFARA
jgi:ComF family protein